MSPHLLLPLLRSRLRHPLVGAGVADAPAVSGEDLALHHRRVRHMVLIGSAVMALCCLGWGLFFALHGLWWAAALDVVAIAGAIGSALLVRCKRQRAAVLLLLAVVFLVVCAISAVFDVPSVEARRSTHLFLLTTGLASCLLVRGEAPWLRHGIPLLCLSAFVFFACTDIGWGSPIALAAEVRQRMVWLNHIIALGTVYALLHTLQNQMTERNGLERDLREAMVRGEMLLHYQAQFSDTPQGERLVGAEALVRWKHPRRGLVSPGEFIPLAERTGLMVPLGNWVLRTACQQLAVWAKDPRCDGLVLAVNVSASQVAQPNFVEQVISTVEATGADPTRLKLELTESMLAHDIDDIITKMTAIKARGIGFSLDDFGTGFSSLSYLRRLPLDQLKIDQSFVREMLKSPRDAAIARTVVDLGRSLGLNVIAEGVETVAQRAYLSSIGCSTYQGYLFSRPIPLGEFMGFLDIALAASAASAAMAKRVEVAA